MKRNYILQVFILKFLFLYLSLNFSFANDFFKIASEYNFIEMTLNKDKLILLDQIFTKINQKQLNHDLQSLLSVSESIKLSLFLIKKGKEKQSFYKLSDKSHLILLPILSTDKSYQFVTDFFSTITHSSFETEECKYAYRKDVIEKNRSIIPLWMKRILALPFLQKDVYSQNSFFVINCDDSDDLSVVVFPNGQILHLDFLSVQSYLENWKTKNNSSESEYELEYKYYEYFLKNDLPLILKWQNPKYFLKKDNKYLRSWSNDSSKTLKISIEEDFFSLPSYVKGVRRVLFDLDSKKILLQFMLKSAYSEEEKRKFLDFYTQKYKDYFQISFDKLLIKLTFNLDSKSMDEKFKVLNEFLNLNIDPFLFNILIYFFK